MKKVFDVKASTEIYGLVHNVNKALENGWELAGNMVFDGTEYLQPMVKVDTKALLEEKSIPTVTW